MNINTHTFNVEFAAKYGLLEAILFNHIAFWIEHNKANEINFHDGDYWTFNSIKAFSTLFPYATSKQIRRALENLRDEGLIKTGNYNSVPYDRTLWYALAPKGKLICLSGQIETTCEENENAHEGEPIPDINQINTRYKPDSTTPNGVVCSTPFAKEVKLIATAWNQMAQKNGLSKIQDLKAGTKRYANLKARLTQYGAEGILSAIDNVDHSPFLLGREGVRPFFITFDWFVLPNNFPKVAEGNYLDRAGQVSKDQRRTNNPFLKMLWEMEDEQNGNGEAAECS